MFRLYLYAFFIVTLIGCHPQSPVIPPANLIQVVQDSLSLEGFTDSHYGHCIVSDGALICHVFDMEERNNPRIRLYNTKTKKFIGEYPWPDPAGGFYFGVDFEDPYLYYFFNGQFFVKINTASTQIKQIDTVRLPSNDWMFFFMIVHNGIAYSQISGDGIDIADINAPLNSHRYHHKGFAISFVQNGISKPLSDSLNITGSQEAGGQFTMFGMNGKADSLWTYRLNLKDQSHPISVLNYYPSFVLKYDSTLVLVNKEGKQIWEKKFDNYVYDILKLENGKVLVLLSNLPDMIGDKLGSATRRMAVVGLNISDGEIDYRYDDVVAGDGRYFLLKDHFFAISDTGKSIDISLEGRKLNTFVIAENMRKAIRIFRDVKTDAFFLMLNGTLYW